MSHEVIIIHQGTGPAGEANGRIEWKPSHTLTPTQEARRREKAEKLLGKALDALYEAAEQGGDGD